ncbi:MAG: right-handed parallel beta-helix repeat-containing protein [bacterium]
MSGLRWAAALFGAVVMTTASAATSAVAYPGSSDPSGMAQRLCALEKRVDRRLGKLEVRVEALEAPSPEVEAASSAPPNCRRVAPLAAGRRVQGLERRTERRVATLEASVQALEQERGLPIVPGGKPRIGRPGATVPQGSHALARRANGFKRSFRKRLHNLTQRLAALENHLPVSTSDLPPEPPPPAPEPPPPAPEPPPPAPEPPSPSAPGPTTGAQAVRENAGPRGAVTQPAGAIDINPGDNIQAKLDAGGANAKFWFRAGTHRISSPLRPKAGQTLAFESGAILKGSRLVTNWTQTGANFLSTGHTQELSSAPFLSNFRAADNPPAGVYEDLFMDGAPLTHVLSLAELGPGKVFFDRAADKMYIRDSPNGHSMEATIATIGIDSSANRVVVRGATIEHMGWIGIKTTGDDWLIEDNEIRYCHASCLNLGWGDRGILRHNYIHHGGGQGISGNHAHGWLYEANEIAVNNYLGFGARPQAHHESGVKLLGLRDSTFRANWSHDNDGDGLWIDTNGINVLVEDNVFENNTRWGFFYEASYAATVRNNLFAHNGVDGPFGGWGFKRGGILISTSRDVEIANNLLDRDVSHALWFRWDNRGSGAFGRHETIGCYTHHNEIRFTDQGSSDTRGYIISSRDAGGTDSNGVSIAKRITAENTFRANVYKTNSAERKWWFWPTAQLKVFSQWQTLIGPDGLGYDTNGSHTQL